MLCRLYSVGLAVLWVMSSGMSTAARAAPARAIEAGITAHHSVSRTAMAGVYGSQPFSFERNEGQANGHVSFLARGPSSTLFLTAAGAVLSFRSASLQQQVVRLHFAGASPHPTIVGLERLPGVANYLVGNNPHAWRTTIPTYARVEYRNVYPGVDVLYFGRTSAGGYPRMEYDLILRPGADLSSIKLQPQGAGKMRIDRWGDLVLGTGNGALRQSRPMIYQEVGQSRRLVAGSYALHGPREVSFRVPSYDRSKRLVIDPILTYSTYLGGSGNDHGALITADAASNAYITGATYSTNFPVTAGAEQVSNGGGADAFITKLNATGGLVFSTYIGGSSLDFGRGIAVDSQGDTYITGQTSSTDFPVTPNAYQTTARGTPTAFVTELNPTGTRLVYSTFLGGSNGDFGSAIAVNAQGDAFVTGDTASSNFPTKNAYQATNHGGADVYVSELNAAGSDLIYSTFLGGTGNDFGLGIALDRSDNAFITGWTVSSDFPTKSAFQTTLKGGSSPIVAELSSSDTLIYSTYIGGSGFDSANGIAVDSSDNAYVTGQTTSADFPVTSNAFQQTLNAPATAFVTKLDPTGSRLVYSTFLGGTVNDQGSGIAVDGFGQAYVTGQTTSPDFPTKNTNHTQFGGGNCGDGPCPDAFVTELDSSGSTLLFSAFLGGSGDDRGFGVAVDSSGNIYVTGETSSANFPTANAYQPTYGGGSFDAFVTKFAPSPTAARVSHFSATRSRRPDGGSLVAFRWSMAVAEGVAAFDLYAGYHLLNHRPILPHRSRVYRYNARWAGSGPFKLGVILDDGRRLTVGTG